MKKNINTSKSKTVKKADVAEVSEKIAKKKTDHKQLKSDIGALKIQNKDRLINYY